MLPILNLHLGGFGAAYQMTGARAVPISWQIRSRMTFYSIGSIGLELLELVVA